jgi:antitoxin component HigA of HigAB toxin-antitoxin module
MGPRVHLPSDSEIHGSGVTELLDRLATLLERHTPERLDAFWETMPKKPTTPETLSETILRTIRERGITSYALAKQSGVKSPIISRWIKGERGLTLATAEKLVQALDLILTERKGKK